ncbi:hypothetical protein [Roseicyclus sp.]|uniref:hypothetical protein n=1 Tax=Roseicyclus sp. TaxID=1914329 RepID=UPI001BD1810F|nr:hypothetical protein [Roseicyclus sp.]
MKLAHEWCLCIKRYFTMKPVAPRCYLISISAHFSASALISRNARLDTGPLWARQHKTAVRRVKTTPPAQPWASHVTTAYWKNEQITRAEHIRQSLHKMMRAAAIRPKRSARFGLMAKKSLHGFAIDYRRAHPTLLRKWQMPPVACT